MVKADEVQSARSELEAAFRQLTAPASVSAAPVPVVSSSKSGRRLRRGELEAADTLAATSDVVVVASGAAAAAGAESMVAESAAFVDSRKVPASEVEPELPASTKGKRKAVAKSASKKKAVLPTAVEASSVPVGAAEVEPERPVVAEVAAVPRAAATKAEPETGRRGRRAKRSVSGESVAVVEPVAAPKVFICW